MNSNKTSEEKTYCLCWKNNVDVMISKLHGMILIKTFNKKTNKGWLIRAVDVLTTIELWIYSERTQLKAEL